MLSSKGAAMMASDDIAALCLFLEICKDEREQFMWIVQAHPRVPIQPTLKQHLIEERNAERREVNRHQVAKRVEIGH